MIPVNNQAGQAAWRILRISSGNTRELDAMMASGYCSATTRIMQQFLYRIQPTRKDMLTGGPTPLEVSVIDQHFQYLKRLVAEGVVFLAGRTLIADERTFGLVILQAPSEVEALELMQNDPAVSCGVMAAELFAYRIALWSPTGPPSS